MNIEIKNVGAEEWLPISEYDGRYLVSQFGNIRSVEKARNLYLRNVAGYIKVELSKNGVKKRKSVHRLVANAFLPNPYGLREVNHKNGNKTDNHVDNLEWVTPSQNTLHAIDTGLAKRKLCAEDAVKIIDLFRAGKTKREIAKLFNVSKSTIQLTVAGKRWVRFNVKILNENGAFTINNKRLGHDHVTDEELAKLDEFIRDYKEYLKRIES